MIFLGAGASAPFDMPTSPELTSKIKDLLSEKYPEILQKIQTNLDRRRRDYNYENILKLLYVVSNPTLVPRNDWTRSFPSDYGVKGDYSNIIDKMFDIIYDDLASPFNNKSNKFLTNETIEKVFNLTYDVLLGPSFLNNYNELIFTTNYDPSLEFWCQKRNVLHLDGSIKQENPDFSFIQNNSEFVQFLNTKLREINVVTDAIPIIRLHGSLLRYELPSGRVIKYNRIKDALIYPDQYKDIVGNKPLIILPGREHVVRGGSWSALHRFYEDRLKGDCLFIGYSFRHEEINDRIKYNLNNNRITKLGVFAPDPVKNLKNLYENENVPEDIVKIKGEFGTKKGMDEFIDKWWTSFSSKDIYYNNVDNWLERRKKIFH